MKILHHTPYHPYILINVHILSPSYLTQCIGRDSKFAGKETVTALIEVKITPQRGEGFDKVAERIYKFDQVKACYLMSSGGFDLTVIVEGKTMREVAMFVSEKLAVQDNVIGTATHFVLKKYKEHGTVFKEKKVSNREVIFI